MRKPVALVLTVAIAGGAAGGASAAVASTATSAHATHASSIGHATSRLTISAVSSGALMFSTKSLKAKAGTISITFVNHAPEGHNLTVVRGTNGSVIGATPTFKGGSKTLTLHLKAGKYTYYCSVPGHRKAGMQGTLTVS